MIPVLIVCYARPEKLQRTLESLKNSTRQVLIFIDLAVGKNQIQNLEVVKVAKSFENRMNIKIRFAEKTYGVGKGVPVAIDWAFENYDEIIIIEDDCFVTGEGYNFFDEYISKLNEVNIMVCGTSPWEKRKKTIIPITVSQYPLIWGWCTTKNNWLELRTIIFEGVSWKTITKKALNEPMKLLELAFFYSSYIRVQRGNVQAWDSLVALNMILKDFRAIIPNINLVENSGKDDKAHHFDYIKNQNQIISAFSNEELSSDFNPDKYWVKKINKEIRKEIYNMRIRHILSPIKAILTVKQY